MQRFTPQFALRRAALGACAATIVILSGCANFSGTALPGSVTVPLSNGSLHGGQQPIQGAHVYLYAASTNGCASASMSLMTPSASGTTTDGNGHAYVTTDANGNFSYGGAYSCTSGQQLYLLALGGNPGLPGNVQNSAIGLSAALGDCANLNSSTHTFMDEVTTVGMAYALEAFMVDPTHVGTSSTNVAGLKAAFVTVNNLVNNTTGIALATTPGGNGAAPQQYVNTLANIISACVNSSSGTSSPCTQLFTYATVTNSAAPQNTLSALINVAAFPGAETANLYSLVPGIAPFQPGLSAQPNDFALGITYTPTPSVILPGPVVIDNAGNIWTTNCQSCATPTATDSLVEYFSDGTFLHSYSNAGIHNTQSLAIDAAGTYIYSTNQAVSGSTHTEDQITKMLISSGALQSGFPVSLSPGTYGTNTLSGISLDNSGEIWTSQTNTGSITETDTNGNMINGSPFFVGGIDGIGTDNIGNIWFAGIGGNNLLQFDTNGDFLNNFTPSGLNQPSGIAINGSNEIWTINNGNSSLSKIEFFSGSNGGGSPFTNIGLNRAAVTAIDGANQVLIANCRASCAGSGSALPDNLLRLSPSGTPNTGGAGTSYGAQIPTFSGAGTAAIDASGNVWVSDSVSGKLTEVVGFAAPTIEPLATAAATGKIGQLP